MTKNYYKVSCLIVSCLESSRQREKFLFSNSTWTCLAGKVQPKPNFIYDDQPMHHAYKLCRITNTKLLNLFLMIAIFEHLKLFIFNQLYFQPCSAVVNMSIKSRRDLEPPSLYLPVLWASRRNLERWVGGSLGASWHPRNFCDLVSRKIWYCHRLESWSYIWFGNHSSSN